MMCCCLVQINIYPGNKPCFFYRYVPLNIFVYLQICESEKKKIVIIVIIIITIIREDVYI